MSMSVQMNTFEQAVEGTLSLLTGASMEKYRCFNWCCVLGVCGQLGLMVFP